MELLLCLLIVTSNLVGIAAVYALAAFVVPGPHPHDVLRIAVKNLLAGVAYTAVFTAAVLAWGFHHRFTHTAWLRERRAPTEREQTAIIQLPLLLGGFQAAYWFLAAGLFAGFNALIGDGLAAQVAITVAAGGALTIADSYLIGEMILRPLSAWALASGPPNRLRVPGVRARAVIAWLLSTALPVAGLMLVAAAALVRGDITTTRLAVNVMIFGAVTLGVGLRSVLVVARANADPIRGLTRAIRLVGAGELDVSVPVYDGTEIGQLQAGFNQMAAGLRDREHIRSVFEHHVGEEVARSALAGDDVLGGHLCQVGVLFVDIVGSTAMTGRLTPSEVVQLLNDFFQVVVERSAIHGGQVNKFEGDGALVVFGAPQPLADPAGSALAAARELAGALQAESKRFDVGIGVSYGEVVAGNVGAPARYEYTVIGDPINEAARLTDLAKGAKGPILASWTAVASAAAEEAERWEAGRPVSLRGRPGRTRLATPRSG